MRVASNLGGRVVLVSFEVGEKVPDAILARNDTRAFFSSEGVPTDWSRSPALSLVTIPSLFAVWVTSLKALAAGPSNAGETRTGATGWERNESARERPEVVEI